MTPTGPDEAAVRAMLLERDRAAHSTTQDTALLVAELPLAGSRADHAVITADGVHLTEIKTVRDTTTRLARQALVYAAVADTCEAAVAAPHLDAVVGLLPDWWAITVITDHGLEPWRDGLWNPTAEPLATAALLWRTELRAAVLEAGQTGGTAGLDRDGLASVLSAALAEDPAALREVVRRRLLDRHWVDLADAVGAVRTVRPTTPSWKAKKRGRRRARNHPP
ncbi:hypothetical protein BH23ACT9_BH23ACT9_33860 [soil metagenome]